MAGRRLSLAGIGDNNRMKPPYDGRDELFHFQFAPHQIVIRRRQIGRRNQNLLAVKVQFLEAGKLFLEAGLGILETCHGDAVCVSHNILIIWGWWDKL